MDFNESLILAIFLKCREIGAFYREGGLIASKRNKINIVKI
jgi:hypothetical protein